MCDMISNRVDREKKIEMSASIDDVFRRDGTLLTGAGNGDRQPYRQRVCQGKASSRTLRENL